MSPLRLFRQGLDTLDIAELLSLPEHEVLSLIFRERSHETRKKARFEKRDLA